MNLEKLVLQLLETGIFKTSEQVIQEFRTEHPRQWRELEAEGEQLFGGGCGAYQQPATRIAQALFAIPAEKVICRRRDSIYEWSKLTEK